MQLTEGSLQKLSAETFEAKSCINRYRLVTEQVNIKIKHYFSENNSKDISKAGTRFVYILHWARLRRPRPLNLCIVVANWKSPWSTPGQVWVGSCFLVWMGTAMLVTGGLLGEYNARHAAFRLANDAWLRAEVLGCVVSLKSKTSHTYSSTSWGQLGKWQQQAGILASTHFLDGNLQ